jgi:hypothetical protein
MNPYSLGHIMPHSLTKAISRLRRTYSRFSLGLAFVGAHDRLRDHLAIDAMSISHRPWTNAMGIRLKPKRLSVLIHYQLLPYSIVKDHARPQAVSRLRANRRACRDLTPRTPQNGKPFFGDKGIRTPDLRLAKPPL